MPSDKERAAFLKGLEAGHAMASQGFDVAEMFALVKGIAEEFGLKPQIIDPANPIWEEIVRSKFWLEKLIVKNRQLQ